MSSAETVLALWECPKCGLTGVSGISGGVGPWPGDGKVRCPSRICEYATVMDHHGDLYRGDDLRDLLTEWLEQGAAMGGGPRSDLTRRTLAMIGGLFRDGACRVSEMGYPVCVVCPECTAIYTPNVAGVNALLADRCKTLEQALAETVELCNALREHAPTLSMAAEKRLRESLALVSGESA